MNGPANHCCGVFSDVNAKMRDAQKSFATDLTIVREFTSMPFHMAIVYIPGSEHFETQRALVTRRETALKKIQF